MKSATEGELLQIRRYLLGRMADEPERRQVEERLLLDNEYFRQVQAVEDDLIEDYIEGALSPGEREPFERHFMAAPERRESVRHAGMLRDHFVGTAAAASTSTALPDQATASVGSAHEPLSGWRRYVPAIFRRTPKMMLGLTLGSTAAVVLAAVCAAVMWQAWNDDSNLLAEEESMPTGIPQQNSELQSRLTEQQRLNEELTRALERERNERLEVERRLAEATGGSRPASDQRIATATRGRASLPPARREVVTVTLMPGQTMSGGESSSVKLPPGARALRSKLIVEDDRHRRYRAELRTDEDGQIWSRGDLRSQQSGTSMMVTVVIPAKLLNRNEYKVTLSGDTTAGSGERVATYSFSVIRE